MVDDDALHSVDLIAEIGWHTHLAWEQALGEPPQPNWCDLEDGDQEDIIAMTKWVLENPTASIAEQHERWRTLMRSPRTPNDVPFDQLPRSQQMKARLWRHVIHAFLGW